MFFLRKKITGNVYVDEDTNGVFDYEFAATVLTGYEEAHLVGDTTTKIEAIDRWGVQALTPFGTIADRQFITDEIEDEVISTTYALLSDDEKQVALRYFVAGSGNDYTDSLYTEAEYDDFFAIHEPKIQKARENRWKAARRILNKDRKKGDVTDEEFELLMQDMDYWTELYINEGLKGTNDGSNEPGLFNYIENNGSKFKARDITAVDTSLDKFTIAGTHKDKFLEKSGVPLPILPYSFFHIKQSTANDGKWTIADESDIVESTDTVIEVVENITDGTVDGKIFTNGIGRFLGTIGSIKTDAMTILRDGEY